MSDTTDSETRSCKMSIPKASFTREKWKTKSFPALPLISIRPIASVRIAPAQSRLQALILCISMSYESYDISVLFSILSSVLLS